jgi:hypothetical protein
MTSHILALLVTLLVEKPGMKLQKAFFGTAGEGGGSGKGVGSSGGVKGGGKKARPRVFENPNGKFT